MGMRFTHRFINIRAIDSSQADAGFRAKDNKGRAALYYIKENSALKASEAYNALKAKMTE